MEKGITVKELIEQLSKFPADTEVMTYDDHFEHSEPCDGVSEYSYYKCTEPGKCFIHYWMK